MVDRTIEPAGRELVVHEFHSLPAEFESIRRLLELHRRTVMVAIVTAQLTALSIVYLVSHAVHN